MANFLITILSKFDRRGIEEAQRDVSQLQSSAQIEMSRPLLGSKTAMREFGDSAKNSAKDMQDLTGKVQGVNKALYGTQALARGDIFHALNIAASALRNKFAQLGLTIAGALGGFSIGWQIGSMIRELTGLGNLLDRLMVQPPVVAKSIRGMANERLAGLHAELQGIRDRLEALAASADKAAARVASVLESRSAQRSQSAMIAELSAPPELRPVVEADNRAKDAEDKVAIADARKAEAEKAAAVAANEVAMMRKRLADAEKEQAGIGESASNKELAESIAKTERLRKELEAARAMIDDTATDAGGMPNGAAILLDKELAGEEERQMELKVKVLGEKVTIDETVNALRDELDTVLEAETNAKKKLVDAETALTQATTDQIKAQNDLAAATKAVDDARTQASANAEAAAARAAADAKDARDKAEFDAAPPEEQLTRIATQIQTVDAMASGEQGPVSPAMQDEYAVQKITLAKRAQDIRRGIHARALDVAQQDAAQEARNIATQAQEQAQFANQLAAGADEARARVLDPRTARMNDRAEAKAKRDKARDDKHISNLLKRAREAGYEAIQGPGGMVDAVKKGNVGPISKRLADAVVADAKAKFAEQQKAEAAKLDREAKEAAKKSVELLDQIRKNTEAGPVV